MLASVAEITGREEPGPVPVEEKSAMNTNNNLLSMIQDALIGKTYAIGSTYYCTLDECPTDPANDPNCYPNPPAMQAISCP